MNRKLSIITVNLNNSAGIRRTMESVFCQTYTNFEFIVIDGASNDGSIDVLKEFALTSKKQEKNQNISLYPFEKVTGGWSSEPDTGIFNAMNKGIKIASGEYLLFLNSGDYLIGETVLTDLFSADYPADILNGRCNILDKGKLVWTTSPPKNITFGTLYMEGLAHQSTFIKRSLFDKYGYYREDLRIMSDWEFWLRTIILNGCSTQQIDIIISGYNLDGISSNEQNKLLIEDEKKQILSQPFFQKIIPDYDNYISNKSKIEIFDWVKKKRFLFYLISIVYKLATKLNKTIKNGS